MSWILDSLLITFLMMPFCGWVGAGIPHLRGVVFCLLAWILARMCRYSYSNKGLLSILFLNIPFFAIAFLYGKFYLPGVSADWIWTLLFIPLGEELLFRGYFYGKYGDWKSAASFAFWHLQDWNFANPYGVLFRVFYAFLMGLWFARFRKKTGSIVPSWALHVLFNLLTNLGSEW